MNAPADTCPAGHRGGALRQGADGVGIVGSHRPLAASSQALRTATAGRRRYELRVSYTEYGTLVGRVRAASWAVRASPGDDGQERLA